MHRALTTLLLIKQLHYTHLNSVLTQTSLKKNFFKKNFFFFSNQMKSQYSHFDNFLVLFWMKA